MRGPMIADYIRRHDARKAAMWEEIEKRDTLHRALNSEYGFRQADGTVPIGKRSSDPAYDARYDEIEANFRPRYHGHAERDEEISRRTLSVYEYLVLDNACLDESCYLREFTREHAQEPWADFIRARAISDVRRALSRSSRVGDVADWIRYHANDFGYRAARCRKLFGISTIDIGATRAIWEFKGHYLSSLRAALNQLSVSHTRP
jgi:hypothetical protein